MRTKQRLLNIALAPLAATVICGAVAGGSAQANTIQLMNGTTVLGTLSDGTVNATLEGYTADTSAELESLLTTKVFQLANSGNGTEATEMNLLESTSFTTDNQTVVNGSDVGSPVTFTINTEFFLLKLDGNQNAGWAFFENTSGGPLTVTYTDIVAGAGSLSHYSTFASAVPGPIVGAGLPGLITAFGGLLVVARRRKQRLA
jgi:hypothetical protein